MNRLFLLSLFTIIVFAISTFNSLNRLDLNNFIIVDKKPQVLDRLSRPLSITFENNFNIHDQLELNEIPEFLKKAFIYSEDKRFFEHNGIDWKARVNAIFQRIRGIKRGASTISEQVVKMINPRPRTLWSRWLEGFEAILLEKSNTKDQILKFYLNQIPYSARRRGLAQASKFYFDRSLNTLSLKEMLALTIIVRAPNSIKIGGKYLESSILALANKLHRDNIINDIDLGLVKDGKLMQSKSSLNLDASHFVKYVLKNSINEKKLIKTSLNSSLQIRAQEILEERLNVLKSKNVKNGSILVVDNNSASILVWSNAKDNGFHDAVTIKRQAGSTLKPFLYALALEKGWNAATIIEDAPIDQAVGRGLHAYKNYSRTFYGPVRLRLALGNSLNTTAIRAISFVGAENFLNFLRKLEFSSLNKSTEFYGDGLALGNAEVSLYELVTAYRMLANQGKFSKLNFDFNLADSKQILSKNITSIISDILSDSQARALEFSAGGILSMPVQTAVKTGTSNDFKDAWAIGYTSTHTVGVWLGNLNRDSMKELSGALGPAYILRSMFAEINRVNLPEKLFLSSELKSAEVCSATGNLPAKNCSIVTEWFEEVPKNVCNGHEHSEKIQNKIYIKYPTPGLNIAIDPRIPDNQEAFEFRLSALGNLKQVDWVLDDNKISSTLVGKYLWSLEKGSHKLYAIVKLDNDDIIITSSVKFHVR